MKVILTHAGAEPPIAPRAKESTKAIADLPDIYGAFSVETFPYADDLKRTHEDAQGFLDYLGQWHTRNFWFKDGSVKNWAFGEEFDNWQDTYGVDAALAVYYSSHGGMQNNGNFMACMGSDWEDQGHFAFSHNMRVGNEQANYVWWSTCLSMRVKDGHDPVRTWAPASLGFRMMFGYETTSVDDGDYGEDFWDEWNQGKSLSTAFLDASWGISSDQIPVAVAVGGTEAESMLRLYHERTLEWGHVSDVWWSWRWYEKANPARRAPNLKLPAAPMIALLRRRKVDGRYVRSVMQRHKIDIPLPRTVKANARGSFHVRHGETRLSFSGDGSYEIEYRKPNMKNRKGLTEQQAIDLAETYIRDQKLSKRTELTFDHIRYSKVSAATKNRKKNVAPFTAETTVEFTQVINGIPVISQKHGRLRISFDNDGIVTRLQNHIREIEKLSRQFKSTAAGPREPIKMHEMDVYRRLLSRGWKRRLKVRKAMGKEPSEMRIVPGTDEIGYEVVGDEMALVARALVEVTMPGGFQKRYFVSHPIVE